jgi:hypothetical protein
VDLPFTPAIETMRILIASTLITIAACASARNAAYEPRPLRGIYRHGWEVQSFRPSGSRENWWVANGADLRPRAERAGLDPDGPLLLELRASVSPPGRFGHLGGYSRQIGVEEVLRVEAARVDRC